MFINNIVHTVGTTVLVVKSGIAVCVERIVMEIIGLTQHIHYIHGVEVQR